MTTTATFYERLAADHRETETVLKQLRHLLEQGQEWEQAKKLFDTLCRDLDRHFACEEYGLFPVLSQYRTMILMEVEHDDLLAARDALQHELEESVHHHQATQQLLEKLTAFEEQILCHIAEEDRGIFPMAESAFEPEEKALVQRKIQEVYDRVSTLPPGEPLLERPQPTYSLSHIPLFESVPKPKLYKKLFQAEHASLHHIQLQANEAFKLHWAPEHLALMVLSGTVLFRTASNEEHTLAPGSLVTLEPRLQFSLYAETESQMLMMKIWPRPHFLRMS